MRSHIKYACNIAITATLLVSAIPTHASEIIVNGKGINLLDKVVLTIWNCGNEIADGHYWMDYTSGAIGVEDGVMLGVLPCYPLATKPEPLELPQARDESDPGSWEDRMCAMGMCDGVIVNPVY